MARLHINAEHLLGRKVVDMDGRKIGRLEEFECGTHDGRDVVLEYHLGTGAALERILAFVRELPFFGIIPAAKIYRVPWHRMDLSDPSHPRFRGRREELRADE